MSTTKYPLHSQYVRLKNAEEAILTNLKNKSTPLVINDSLVPPINKYRSDLPWNLGSKANPWKNLYISNCGAEDLTPQRTEVIDVYTTLTNSASKDELLSLKAEIESTYATLNYTNNLVQTETRRLSTETVPGAIKLQEKEIYFGYYPETVSPKVYVFTQVSYENTLIKIDGTPTNINYWDRRINLYTELLENYEGTDFIVQQVKSVFPGVFKPEFDDFYIIVYQNTTGCVQDSDKKVESIQGNAVYLDNNGNAFVNPRVASHSQIGAVKVDNTTIVIDNTGKISATGVFTNLFCGNWDSWNSVPITEDGFYNKGLPYPLHGSYLIINNDTSHEHIGGTWRYKYHAANPETYNKDNWKPEYEILFPTFTPEQQAAINSTITVDKVTQYDAYAVNKVGTSDYATTTTAGIVKVDGTSIIVDSTGKISSTAINGLQVVLGDE